MPQLRAISSGKALHVKACYAMREALELLDFEDASITDMKRMLLQVCAADSVCSALLPLASQTHTSHACSCSGWGMRAHTAHGCTYLLPTFPATYLHDLHTYQLPAHTAKCAHARQRLHACAHTQAAISPAFVSRPEGRKFLSCLLTVHPSMVQEMASVIRNQVRMSDRPSAYTSMGDAPGTLLFLPPPSPPLQGTGCI